MDAIEAVIEGRAVHPHVCGEHKDAEGPFNHFGGSSPRVWGT